MKGDLKAGEFELLRRGRFGAPLRSLAVTGSTNSDALEWAAQGAPEGAVVTAAHQTAGRGRWGRSWLSEPGRALLFSLVLRPALAPSRTGLLTTALGVAVAHALRASAGLDPGLKWPNDVVVDERKIAGILVESRVVGSRVEAAVAGVGVNVGWRERDLPEEIAGSATSMAVACSRRGLETPAREAILAEILARFEPLYDAVASGEEAPRIVEAASMLSVVLGSDVAVRLGSGETLEGTAVAIDPRGALVVETQRERVTVDSGEVTRVRRSDRPRNERR